MYPQFLCLFRFPLEKEKLEMLREAIRCMWSLDLSERDRNYLKLAEVVLSVEPTWTQ